jgi:pimeloyl-ACP methyl ester carboxylesterase
VKTVAIGPTVTAYEEHGTGAPLVLIHGGYGWRQSYDRTLVPRLGDGIRAITYDQRDAGDTTSDGQPFTMSDLAADCVGLMDALGLDQAHVFGTSFGGMVAMRVAIDYPGRIRSLVLSSTTPGGAVGKADIDRLRESRLELAAAAGAADRRRQVAEAFYSPDYLARHPELAEKGSAGFKPKSLEAMQRRVQASWSQDCCDVIDRIVAPTLIVHGTEDPIVRVGQAEWMAKQIPGARLVTLEGLRHAWFHEQPETAAALVREHVLAHA